MSAGSNASNLGYGNIVPLSNVDGKFVNVTNSHSAQNFGNRVIPGTPPGPLPGLAGTKDNVVAAKGIWQAGGAKKLKRKIKNITKKYKMKGGSRRRRSLRKRIKSKYSKSSKSHHKRSHTKRRRSQRGGYAQYQNNLPMTPTYSVGGILNSGDLGLANPPPIKVLGNCTNCVDNYNHFTNAGFPSKGH